MRGMRASTALLLSCLAVASLSAQTNRIDGITPSAPELAAFGAARASACAR